MKCPYCENIMESGFIFGERGDLNWYSEEDTTNYLAKVFGFGGIKISKKKFNSPVIKACRCIKCKKIIIDLS